MLVSQLQKLLRNERQGCVLGALAGLAVFHIQGDGGARGGGDGNKEAGGWEGASEFFGEKKCERVLSLVCLNVISAVGSGTGAASGGAGKEKNKDGGEGGMSWEERLEQVEYAKVIVDAVVVEGRWKYLEGEGRKGRVLENLVGKLRKLIGEGDVGTAENGQKEGEKKEAGDAGVKERLVRAAVEFLVRLVGPGGKVEGNSKGITAVAGLVEFVEGLVGRGTDHGWLIAGEDLGVLFAVS